MSTGPARAGDDAAQFLLFSGADLWRDGRFMHGGLLWSPAGLDREGFTLQLMASGRLYRYRSGALNNAWVTGAEEEAQLLPGWRFKRDRFEVKVFAGPDIKNDVTSPYDPSNRLHGTSVGIRGAVNLWFEPTPATMVAADASLSSIATGYSARAAYGWKLHDWFYLGPEAQMRVDAGLHANPAGRHVGKACFNLATRPLLTQHNRAAIIVAYDMERVLADIAADHGDCNIELLRHGVLLVFGAPCQLKTLAGQEHGRTIPLATLAVHCGNGFDVVFSPYQSARLSQYNAVA